MNPDGRRIDIAHGVPCRCQIDRGAVYVRRPCRVVGWHVTKRRIAQIIYALRRRSTDPPP